MKKKFEAIPKLVHHIDFRPHRDKVVKLTSDSQLGKSIGEIIDDESYSQLNHQDANARKETLFRIRNDVRDQLGVRSLRERVSPDDLNRISRKIKQIILNLTSET